MVPSDLAFDRHRRLVPAIITGSAPLPMAGTGPAMTYGGASADIAFGGDQCRSGPNAAYNSITPPRRPLATAAARLVASSFANSASRWNLTVCTEMPSCLATDLLLMP